MISQYLDFIFLSTLIITVVLRETKSIKSGITGYPGSTNQLEFYLYTHPLTWREAVRACSEENLWIMGVWSEGLSYVKSVALKHKGWNYDGLWINYVHHAGSLKYQTIDSCDDNVQEQIKNQIDGYDSSTRQCLYVNTSSPNADETNLFVGPCERKMPYLCGHSLGDYTEDPDSTVNNKNKKFKTQDDVRTFDVANLDDCISRLFGSYSTYAAEFDSSSQSCRVKKAAKVSELPILFEIISSTDGEVVLYKNSQPVELRSKIMNVQPIDWPCWSEPVVNGLVPEPTSLTSESGKYQTYMYSYAGVDNETCCTCHSAKTYGELDTLTLLDKQSLSRFKMKKISASDARVSATTIGCFGAVTLITVCCVIISADIHSVFIKLNRKRHDKFSRKVKGK